MALKPNTSSQTGSIRIGPVTIISLVIILFLAVMAVLSFTTARATSVETDKQRQFISSTYSNEQAAQEYLAQIDAILASSSSMAQVAQKIEDEGMAGVNVDGNEISYTFVTGVGRRLSVTLEIESGMSHRITQWQTSTDWTMQESNDQLWAGN